MDSILDTIKSMLGYEITPDPHFDGEIMTLINAAFSELSLIGVIDDSSYLVTSRTNTWHDVFGGRKDVEFIKKWVFLSVKMTFDPPSSSFVMNALQEEQKRLTWYISIKGGDENE